MLKFISPDPMAPVSEAARLREVELIVSRFRWAMVLFSLPFELLRGGPVREVRLAATLVFLLSCVIATWALRRPLTLRQIRALGIFVVVCDIVTLTVAMLSDTGRGEVGLWSSGILVTFEAAVRWFVIGSVSTALAMSGSTFIWMLYRSRHSNIEVSPAGFLFRSVILVSVGLALGVIVQVLEEARSAVARRLRESEVVNRFALRAPEMSEAAAVEVLAKALHDDLDFERVVVHLHDPETRLLLPGASEGYPPELVAQMPEIAALLDGVSADDPRSLSARCFSTGRPIVARRSDGPDTFGPTLAVDRTESKLAVPMRAGGRILGVIEVSSTRRDAYEEDDAQLLESLASELAQVLEHARLGEMRRETIEELQRLAAMKEDFIAIASHELRTPITALRGFARVLASPNVTPEREHQAVEVINRQVDRLGVLVEDLLAASLIDSGASSPLLEPIELASVAREILAEAALGTANHELRTEVADDLPPVMADPQFLRRILVNLVSNAVKYSPDGGSVELAASCRGREVRVTVRDQGIGISAADQLRLFEKFMRVPTKGGPGGTGLGLFIVQGLVEAMGGTVHVVSSPGRGSEFSFTLLSAEAGRGGTPPAPSRPGVGRTS